LFPVKIISLLVWMIIGEHLVAAIKRQTPVSSERPFNLESDNSTNAIDRQPTFDVYPKTSKYCPPLLKI
jgi:hypothetical protein